MKKDNWKHNPNDLPRWKRLSPAEPDATNQPGVPSEPRDRHDPTSSERLQKILAQAGIASRRAAEELIAAGRVTVNGEVVKEMGVRADPATDTIAVDGKPLKLNTGTGQAQKFVYIALNKPLGVVSTVKDPEGRPTVMTLLASAKLTEQGLRLYPVGRLDTDSTGLLLLTNDGDLTFRLTHPRYEVDKEYHVIVRGRPTGEALNKLREGVMIEGGLTAPAKIDVLSRTEGNTSLRITIREGRKRQVRLMCAAVGHPVIELTRVRFGPIELGDLQPGKWRNLAVHEAHALRKAVKLKSAGSNQVASPTPPAPAPAKVNARTRPSRRPQPTGAPHQAGASRTRPTSTPARRPSTAFRPDRPKQESRGTGSPQGTETRPRPTNTRTRTEAGRGAGTRPPTSSPRSETGAAPRRGTGTRSTNARSAQPPRRKDSSPRPSRGQGAPPRRTRGPRS
ncbi:MAG: rRNA synthase [Chloroflexia bacterium]|jgi:pseudouridine synthase|nr:rRNA synthase [Chloroflexia bacterium]